MAKVLVQVNQQSMACFSRVSSPYALVCRFIMLQNRPSNPFALPSSKPGRWLTTTVAPFSTAVWKQTCGGSPCTTGQKEIF